MSVIHTDTIQRYTLRHDISFSVVLKSGPSRPSDSARAVTNEALNAVVPRIVRADATRRVTGVGEVPHGNRRGRAAGNEEVTIIRASTGDVSTPAQA